MSTYLVTGITSGIGQHCAQALLAQNHQVVSLCRNLKKAQDLFPQACAAGQLVLIEYDFGANGALYRTCIDALAPYQIAGLVHCAGQTVLKRIIKTDYATTLRLIEVNFFSFSEMCRALLHLRQPEQELSLLTISSMAALRPTPATPMYACVKGLLNHYVQALAYEFKDLRFSAADPLIKAQQGYLVRVNAIAPGLVATPMNSLTLEAIATGQSTKTLLPITAVVELALATLSNRFITGQVLAIDNN